LSGESDAPPMARGIRLTQPEVKKDSNNRWEERRERGGNRIFGERAGGVRFGVKKKRGAKLQI